MHKQCEMTSDCRHIHININNRRAATAEIIDIFSYNRPQTGRRVLRESDKRDKNKTVFLFGRIVLRRNSIMVTIIDIARTRRTRLIREEHCVSAAWIHWPLFVFTRACGRIALYLYNILH